MRILNLILYSDTLPEYVEMQQIQRLYLKEVPNIECYFYVYRPSQSEEVVWEGDTIYLRGEETMLGILAKTVRVMELTRDKEYDYVLRTNISTLVNIPALMRHLREKPIQYGGERLHLNWEDPVSGITPDVLERYRGIPFVRGIAIVLSRNTVHKLLDTSEIPTNLMDDLAIGIACRNLGIQLTNMKSVLIENPPVFVKGPIIIYRNKSNERSADCQRMQMIARALRQIVIHERVLKKI